MNEYSVQNESKRFLYEKLLNDEALALPAAFSKAADKITFIGDSKPFLPTPCKITESSSALSGLVAAAASAIAVDRYGIDEQGIEINT
jgi:hypothetical protein